MQNSPKLFDDQYRVTLVRVTSYENCELCGLLHNPFFEDGTVPFFSTMDFLVLLNKLMDDIQAPQSFEKLRQFKGFGVDTRPVSALRGSSRAIANFEVRILFRQHATWQGSVQWLERKEKVSFRSAFELLMLMNDALQKSLQA